VLAQGDGVEENRVEALRWANAAAERGVVQGLTLAGWLLVKAGEVEMAMRSFRVAAQSGELVAARWLKGLGEVHCDLESGGPMCEFALATMAAWVQRGPVGMHYAWTMVMMMEFLVFVMSDAAADMGIDRSDARWEIERYAVNVLRRMDAKSIMNIPAGGLFFARLLQLLGQDVVRHGVVLGGLCASVAEGFQESVGRIGHAIGRGPDGGLKCGLRDAR
jgi:hypothetical protein